MSASILAAFAVMASAQEVTASINGVITDPSGSSVPGVTVTAKDMDRGSTFPTTTNGSGFYSLPRLPIGKYEIHAESKGFRPTIQSNVILQLNQTAKIDISLQVGDVSTAVEVTSAAPILETESTQLGTVIDARTNVSLPLATRNYVELTLLTAGAVTSNPSGFKSGQTTFNSERPHINGNREQTNNFLLDGLDNNQISDNLVAYAPSVDAIEEFNEITQNPGAEFGNFMGGITSVSIKSGTNSVHGTAFEFFRNDKLNANEWSNNLAGNPRSPLRWNMFGGALGGPIKKDKIFAFGDYQGTRFNNPVGVSNASLFTVAERNGDFSALTPTVGQLYNPFALDSKGNRIPFANNQIPLSLFSPAALKVLNSQYYPTPTSSGFVNNYQYSTSSFVHGDQGDAKVDWNISDKDRFFGRYTQAYINNPSINSLPLQYNGTNFFKINNGALDYTRTISPSIVNDVRFGVNYNYNFTGAAASSLGNLPSSYGIPGVPTNILPALNITGGYANSIGNSDNIQLFADTVVQYEDTVIVTKGSHTIKLGFQGERIRLDTFYSGNNGASGSFNFNGQFTAGPGTLANAGAADFVLGLPSQVGVGTNGGTWGQRGNIFTAFAQDTWRVTPHLTLNYGLHYELHTPWIEVHNRQSNFTEFTGVQVVAGTGSTILGNSRALYNQYNGAFNYQPRIGFAYTPNDKTVVRAAFSISSFLEGTGTNLRLTINPPFSVEKTAVYTSVGNLPLSTLDQGYTTIASPSDPLKGANLHIWDPNFRPAIAMQWNFSLQHQLSNTTTLQAAYVGQKNDHLVVAQPWYQNILNANGTVTPGPYLQGNPALRADIGNISATEASGNQEYDALQLTLQQRLAHGLNGQLAYSYSKCMTDSTGFYGSGGGSASGQSPYTQYVYNRKAEWAECGYDVQNYITAFLSYDLPFGRGRKFGGSMNKYADAVVGGWQVNGILTFHGGFPITMFIWDDPSGTGARGARASCPMGIQEYGRKNAPLSLGGGYEWVNPADFVEPTAGTLGTCGPSVYRGPGAALADLSASKKFHVTEKQNLEFRGEFINALNHPILNSPNATVGSTAGFIQGSQGARNIQFGLKYNF